MLTETTLQPLSFGVDGDEWKSHCGQFLIRRGRNTGLFFAYHCRWDGDRDIGTFQTLGDALGACDRRRIALSA